MNLIQITQTNINGADVNSVNARELWENLEVKQEFANWIKKQIHGLGLIENQDYIRFDQKVKANNATIKEYIITIDIAKHIALASRTPKGRETRDYFIEAEKTLRANKPKLPQNYKEALIELVAKVDEIERLENKIKADRPLVSFAKSVEASINSVLIQEWVKSLCEEEGVKIGRNRAFKWLRDNKYLMNEKNEPYQVYMDCGYFERVPYTYAGSKGTHQTFTTKITGKGQIALATKLINAFKNVA